MAESSTNNKAQSVILSRVIGKNIRRLRTQLQMTQEQVAERAEMSVRYFQTLEAGRCMPTVRTVFKVARALGVSYVVVLEEDWEGN